MKAAVADSGLPPSRRRGASGAERKSIAAVALLGKPHSRRRLSIGAERSCIPHESALADTSAALADSGLPPSRRRGASGAKRCPSDDRAALVSFLSHAERRGAEEKRGIADWESRLPGGGNRAVP